MLIGIIDKLLKNKRVDINEEQQNDEKIKESSELDFWLNTWNKQIINKVLSKYHLTSTTGDKFVSAYDKERVLIAQNQLTGILWMAKKAKGYLDNKDVVEIGPGCCCALEVSKAKTKIAIEPLAQKYRENNLLLRNNNSTIYLTTGAETIPLFSNFADVVIASNCLDHVEDIVKTIREIYRILKLDGELFLNVEINHRPTKCEPFSITYFDLKELFKQFRTVFVNQTSDSQGRKWVRAVYKKK